MARISPLRGSMATKAPARVSYSEFWIACASARSPVFCRSLSIVSRSRWPCLGSVTDSLALFVAGAERVDDEARGAVRAAQVLVVLVLEAALPDPRALGDVLVLALLHLLGADLGDRAEQLGGELALGVLAQVALGDDDALEVLGALAHEVELGERDVRADGDVRVRRVRDAADDALVDRLRADVDRLADAAVELGRARARSPGIAGIATLRAVAPSFFSRVRSLLLGLGRLAPVVLELADERVVLALVREPLVLGRGQLLAVVVGVLADLLGQLATARAGRRRPSSCARARGPRGPRCRRAAPRCAPCGGRSGSRRRGRCRPSAPAGTRAGRTRSRTGRRRCRRARRHATPAGA